jgi:large subunit ribosomal protein L31
MKPNIHPQFHRDTQVICSCGNTFTTGSNKASIHVEVCSKCHPFYTGEQRFLDTGGRVDRFKKKMEVAQQYKVTSNDKKKKSDKTQKESKSLRELLGEV